MAETLRNHSRTPPVFPGNFTWPGIAEGNVMGLHPKKRHNLLTGKEVMKLPERNSLRNNSLFAESCKWLSGKHLSCSSRFRSP